MKSYSWLYTVIIFTFRCLFKCFYRYKIYGIENYPEGGGLIVANHASFLDPPIVAVSCPEPIHFLARETLFKSWFGKLISRVNSHPIRPGAMNLNVMKEICRLIKTDKKVLIFPEGTRSEDNTLKEIRPGISLLLSKSQSLIVPIYIDGAFDIWKKGQKFPKLSGHINIIFGAPIRWSTYSKCSSKDSKKLIISNLNDYLKVLKNWCDSGCNGSVPS